MLAMLVELGGWWYLVLHFLVGGSLIIELSDISNDYHSGVVLLH